MAAMLCLGVAAYGQSLSGRVVSPEKEGLEGVNVVVTDDSGHVVCYAITGEDGTFSLDVPKGAVPKTVKASYMGYKTLTMPFSSLTDGMAIEMARGKYQLREVTVKAPRIIAHGDTLTYSVAQFRHGQDRSIADVIAKMPGLEVGQNGQISYQGMAINKFYIEGLDLMGSQYGVADKNIPAGKVRSVQVLQNHQPVKSLRGVSFSEQAALNLVLENDAKDVWSGVADAGLCYGDGILYDCRLMGMRFGRKSQALMVYKNNNAGDDISTEISSLATQTTLNDIENERGLTSLMSVGAPNISSTRYTFNHSHLMATNWLWKTGKDATLRLQGSGFLDKENLGSYSSTTYLTIPGTPIVVEQQEADNTASRWKVNAEYQLNGNKTYVKNNLRAYADFDKSKGTMDYDGIRTEMSVKPRKQNVTNEFNMSHTTAKGNVYEVKTLWNYVNLPGKLLTIDRGTEDVALRYWSFYNALKYTIKIGKIYLNNEVGIDYDYQGIGLTMDGGDKQSRGFHLTQVYYEPSITYMRGSHRFRGSARLKYVRQSYCGTAVSHVWADPRISWLWQVTPRSDISAAINYGNTPLMLRDIYDLPIYTDYRNIMVNRGQNGARHRLYVAIGYKFTDPVKGLFFNVRPYYGVTRGNVLYSSSMDGDVVVMTASDKDHTSTNYGLSARLSQSFSWAGLFFGIGGRYNVNRYGLLIGDNVGNARMTTTSVTFNYSARPVKQVSIEGESDMTYYKQNGSAGNNIVQGHGVIDWKHSLDVYVFPSGKWMVGLKNELFHNNERSYGVNYYCDAVASYKTKRWELSLSINNLFDTSQMNRRMIGETMETYTVTTLRPREFIVKYSVDL